MCQHEPIWTSFNIGGAQLGNILTEHTDKIYNSKFCNFYISADASILHLKISSKSTSYL